ncbi:MAG: ATP-dependent Clp protease ATP-binding subunit [Clostridia bacterium]|nr:ATP-dependent Clp protease ATP-binding subunit [Clostridia bacterium]
MNTPNLSENLQKALDAANRATIEYGAVYVGSEHLLYGFLCVPACQAARLLNACGVTKDNYLPLFRRTIDPRVTAEGMTERTKNIFRKAILTAEGMGMKTGTAHLLDAVLGMAGSYAVRILQKLGVDVEDLQTNARDAVEFSRTQKQFELDEGYQKGSFLSHDLDSPIKPSYATTSGLAREEGRRSPAYEKLSQYGTDITLRARQGKLDPVIGRAKETEKVIQVLCRRSKNNPVLMGEPGVGKSAIVEGLAQAIAAEKVPEQLIGKTVFSVDLPGMVAGAKYRGDFEERLKDLIEAVIKDGDIVLFIDEIHTIVGAGSTEGSMDAANILKPLLARGDMQVIGATTIEEYRKYIEKDAALERRFTPVLVEEPSHADAVAILKGLRGKYEEHHGVVITDEAIEAAVTLSSRYITDRYLPDKAIDLIDEAASAARISKGSDESFELQTERDRLDAEWQQAQSRGEYARAMSLLNRKKAADEKLASLSKAQTLFRLPDGRLALGKEQVAAVVSARSGVPLTNLSQEESDRLLKMEETLHERIVGQHEGVVALSKAIRRARAGLKDPSRPVGSFIFVGPTGVGKTDLCKALATFLFGNEESMIRLDMSEYMEKQAVSKIIGAPPGYVGFEESSGQLTDKVRSKPYSVVLFDEIEKAHPDVFNLLLQILDDGRLTDSKGRTVSFKNTVIILTSNVGAAIAKEDRTGVYGFGAGETKDAEKEYEEMKERITGALKEKFRPEFLNRLDDVIVFHPLSKEEAAQIAEKILGGLCKRLKEQRNITLYVTDAALQAVVESGYDSEYGARPLKRAVRKEIEDKLSEEILLGRVRNGQKVCVDYVGGKTVFTAQS